MVTSEIFISLDSVETFDWTRINVGEPKKHSFTKGDKSIEWYTSEVYYLGEDGEKLSIFFELPKQSVWMSGVWPFSTEEEEKSFENIEGYQIAYSLDKDSKNPTSDEERGKKILDKTWDITVDALKKFCSVPRDDRKVPNPTYSSFKTAKEDGDFSYAVKPVWNYSLTKDERGKKTVDMTKSPRTYIKFLTNKKGLDMTCSTKIFGPGDKEISPKRCIRKSMNGICHPVIYWKGIFWGSHGQKASYGASVQLRVHEMNFTPIKRSVSNTRFLRENTDSEKNFEEFEENESFIQ